MSAHTAGLLVAQAIRAISPLATLPLIAYSVSGETFGLYTFFLTLAQASSVLIDFGYSYTGYRLVNAHRATEQGVFAAITALKLALGAAFAALLVALAFAISPSSLAYCLAAGALATALGMSGLWFLNWKQRTGLLLLFEALPVAAMTAAATLVATAGFDPIYVLWAGAAGAVIGPLALAMPGWLAVARSASLDLVAPIIPSFREQLPVAAGRLVVVVYTVALIPFGRLVVDLQAIGQYAASEKLGSLMGVLGVVAAQTLAPLAVRSADDADALVRLVRRALLLGAAVTALVVLPLAIFAGPLVRLLFGPNFAALDLGAAIVVIASGLAFWSTLIWNGFAIPLNQNRGFLPIMIAGALISAATVYLLGAYGYLALSGAKLVAEFSVLVLTVLAVALPLRRRLRRSAGGQP